MAPLRVAIDWDGTVTERDTLHMVIERFGDLEVFGAMEAGLRRRRSLDEVIGTEMRTIRTPLPEVVAWLLENVRVRPGFAELIATHDPLVVSAGFHELIGPVLTREGIAARVVANRLDPRPGGWLALFRDGPLCEVCGERCKRTDVDDPAGLVYVGDGYSDRCLARAAGRVFARDGLAGYLDRMGVAYEPYEDLHDVIAGLRSEVGTPSERVSRAGDSRGG